MANLNFTKDCREALRLAQLAARELGHGYVGSEHLLLGLAAGEGAAARLMREAGATEKQLRDCLIRCVGEGIRGSDPAQGLTLHARGAVEEAARSAGELESAAVDTVHLLLGLLKGRQNMACRLLRMVEADPDGLYARSFACLRGTLRKSPAPEVQTATAPQEKSFAHPLTKKWSMV